MQIWWVNPAAAPLFMMGEMVHPKGGDGWMDF